jgi:hypothetical protein
LNAGGVPANFDGVVSVSLREKLNERPSIVTGATLAIIVIAMALIVWQVIRGNNPPPGKSYFTTDDGVTFFELTNDHVPPFKHSGKTAVRAYVFSCDGGKTKFVGFLERYTAEAKKTIEAALAHPNDDTIDGQTAIQTGAQVKLPRSGNDDSKWILRDTPEGQALMDSVKCDHDGDLLETVEPAMN